MSFLGMHMGIGWALAVTAAFIGGLTAAGRVGAAGDGDSPAYHVLPTAEMRAAEAKRPDLSGAVQSMLYFGGPVISHVKIVSVIWGADVNPATVKRAGPFLRAVANSTFLTQLAQYRTDRTGTNGHAGTNQTIGRGTYRGQIQIKPINASRKLTDAAVQTELRAQIAAGKLPKADLNTLYVTFFPQDITITSYGKSCVAFGAYHSASSTTVRPSNLFYAVVPDCGQGFADLTFSTSHEVAEAVSDAIPTPGSHPAFPQAWNTFNGYEIADLCESKSPVKLTHGTQNYRVARVFLNSTHKCASGPYTSP
jgi:hypothetical protein